MIFRISFDLQHSNRWQGWTCQRGRRGCWWWLSILAVPSERRARIVYPYCLSIVSVIYEFVFVFQNVRNIFFSSCFLVSHINTLPVTMYEQWQGFLRVFVRLDTINYRISVTVVYNITTITLFTPVVNEVSDIRLITNKMWESCFIEAPCGHPLLLLDTELSWGWSFL